MKGLSVFGTVTAATLVLAGMASAATIRISQESAAGAGDFDANVLGTIASYDTALTISDFYQYDTPNYASYNGELNGGPSAIGDTTISFFVAASDGLHFVNVHDAALDGSGGRTRMTHTLAGGAGGSAAITDSDDPGESNAVSDVGTDRIFDTTRDWAACCTDGYAIGDLGTSFTLFGEFDVSPTGITSWLALDSSGSSLALALDSGRAVRFDMIAAVPLPASGLLLLAGLGALASRRRG